MKSHKSEVAITKLLFEHQPGHSVCVGKDTSKQNIQNMKANVKSKQQQLSNKYSNHVVYLQVTIIHDGNCDKMINNQAHKLCALKTRISQYRGEYTRDGQSIN